MPNIKRLRQIGFASGVADFNSDPIPQHNLEALAEVLRDSDVRFEFLEHDGDDVTELLWEWALADVVLPFMADGFTEVNSG